MQDHEETSLAEVIGRGPMSDRMRLIRCQATVGVDSYDQTLSEAVIGCTGDTVHCHGSVFSMTGHSRLDDRTHEVQRPIEFREVLERRQCDRTRPVDDDRTQSESDQCVHSNGRDDQTRPVRM